MNIVHEMPEDRDEAAALWCMRLAEGPLTFQERSAFHAWIAIPDNAAAFDIQAKLWDVTAQAADAPEIIRWRSDALSSFQQANKRRWSGGNQQQFFRRYLPVAAAASIFLALTIAPLLVSGGDTFHTGIGERQVLVLEDGSRLTLDADSAVDVRMTPHRRELRVVRGRAKFDVAKDPLRPFAVQAGTGTVVATGTSFSVERLDQTMSVILYEGSVSVLRGEDMTASPVETLTPGRALTLPLTGSPRITSVETSRSLAWQNGQLDFNAEPLPGAVERVNRYAKRRIVIDPSVPPGLRVTGVFDGGDVNAFVEGVAAVNGLEVRSEAGRIVLAKR